MIRVLLKTFIVDILELVPTNPKEKTSPEKIIDCLNKYNSDIYQELKGCVPAKKEITYFQMECQNIPVCKDCGNYYGEVHDKLIHNKIIDTIHKNLKKACGVE